MISLASLWLPILASAIAIFIASSIVWMVLPYHKTDWKGFKNESAFLDAVRAQNAAPGMYMFPHCKSPADMKDPAKQELWKKGPWGTVILPAGSPSMGRSLTLWFIHLAIVSVFVAYLAGHVLGAGAPYLSVFRITGTTAFVAFAAGIVPGSIWEGKPWSFTFKHMFDGLIYALLVAGMFGWLWPHAAS